MKLFGYSSDIEFTIKDQKLIILQVRPVITDIKNINTQTLLETNIGYKCLLVSGENLSNLNGNIYYVKDVRDFEKISDKGIILVETLSDQYIHFIEKIKGIICLKGGMLSHMAIIAREYGCPVVRLETNDLGHHNYMRVDFHDNTLHLT